MIEVEMIIISLIFPLSTVIKTEKTIEPPMMQNL